MLFDKKLWPDDLCALKAYYHVANESLSYLLPALELSQTTRHESGLMVDCYKIDSRKYAQVADEMARSGDPMPDFTRFLALVGALRRDMKDDRYREVCMVMVPRLPKPSGMIGIVTGFEERLMFGNG